MTFYTDAQNDADELLREFGQALTLTKKTSGAYDPATGAAAVTSTTYGVIGAVFDFPARAIDGTIIQQGDKKAIIAARSLSVVPDITDSLTVKGIAHQIVNVKALEPAGTTVIYTLQIRTP